MASRSTHPVGKPAGLSPADLQRHAKPAAYLKGPHILGRRIKTIRSGGSMAKAEASVGELVGMIERGELRLPEMQRRYVWRSTQVRDLMDSLYRGYPSGMILLWDTDEVVPEQGFGVSQAHNPFASTRLLLDGQQRLTSLAAVIRGEPVTVRNRKKPIDLLFNLEHPESLHVVTEVDEDGDDEQFDGDLDESTNDEEEILDEADADVRDGDIQRRFDQMIFVVATNKLAAQPNWVKVSDVFRTDEDAPFLGRAGIERVDDPRYTKYSQRLARLRRIRNYSYRMEILERTLSYDEVTEVFVRVNSLGTKLRSSDLALAQITSKWRNSLEKFEEFQNNLTNTGFDLDLGVLLKNMVAFATTQSRFRTVGGLSKEQLESAWRLSCDGMDFAVNFVKSNAEIDSPVLLSSPFLLIALSFYGHKREYRLSEEEASALRFWTLIANAKGRYSHGSSETLLDQDLATIRDGGGPRDLVERLRLQVGRLDVTPEELVGRNQRSALFKTMFLAFRAAGARDWESKLTIGLDHRGATHRLQFHHIFPKAVLRGHYSPREADDIANLAFIAGWTNRVISAKAPSDYIPALMGKIGVESFEAQCVPTNVDLLDVAHYEAFLEARRLEVSRRLNDFLGTA